MKILIVTLLCLNLLTKCESDDCEDDGTNNSTPELTNSQNRPESSMGMNPLLLASKLARNAKSTSKDYVISPLNLKVGLEILNKGIKRESECGKKFQAFIGDDSEATMKFVKEYKNFSKEGVQITMVNRIFVKIGNELVSNFNQSLSGYEAQVNRLKFDNVDKERKCINNLISKDTNGLIKNMLPDGVPTTDTELMSINSLYQRSSWRFPFEKTETKLGKFTTENGARVNLKFMNGVINMYVSDKNDFKAKVYVLDYTVPDFIFVIVKPRSKITLNVVEEYLFKNPEKLAQSIAEAELRDYEIYIPIIKTDFEFDLQNLLVSEGLSCIFENGVDNMVVGQELTVSTILQKTVFEASEEGTEASSATEIALVNKIGDIRKEKLNVPFLYMVVHKETGNIMFSGRFANPSSTK